MKKIPALLLLLAMLLALSACAPSPTAVTVDGRKIDASEYAFYLTYARRVAGVTDVTFTAEELEAARQDALRSITTQEVVRLKCKAFGLELSDGQRAILREEKDIVTQNLGGAAKYLEYLQSHALTDRLYDKTRENALYYEALRAYAAEELDQELYTDEAMRRFFGEHYILVKYIRVTLLDDDGMPLSASLIADLRRTLNQAHAAATQGQSFDDLMLEYNDDPVMVAQPAGLVVSDLDLDTQPWLGAAFGLKNGTVSEVIQSGDGLYILKRLELSAGYFEYNREALLARAQARNFTRLLAQWEDEAVVKTKKVIEKIDLQNYMEYVK